MAQLKINLEQGNGFFYAHATEFLGCFAKATSRSEVIDAILKDVKIYSEWLLKKEISNEYIEKAKKFTTGINELEIVEEQVDIQNLEDPKSSGALFDSDKKPISEEQLEFYISLIKSLPDLLLKMVFPLSAENLDLEIIKGKPTIEQILTEIYNVLLFFISKFGPEVEQNFFDTIDLTKDEVESLSVLERVIKIQQGAIATLRLYFPKFNEKIFPIAGHPEEIWTIKKAIRKIIEFERECIEIIRDLVEKIKTNLPEDLEK
ncbi:MAG: hypothetical protein EAX90_10840 [Candidatus Heimdallarchaeota archaeon]|nr:hypothetical protein [Candidatus Heimdallarchaeota archaeon]